MMTPIPDLQERPASRTVILSALPEPSTADEINHRIANSLQLLAAMVSAAGRTVTDPYARSTLDMTVRRIAAIARVNRQLYQRPMMTTTLDLASYITELGNDLEGSFGDIGPGRRIRVVADTVLVLPEHASCIGIIVSELVTNACKHAYAADALGDVQVRLKRTADGYRLEVEDRGTGAPASAFVGKGGLGHRLIESMTVRVKGRLAREDARPGTRHVLHVPHR